jgi:hypothetical protein
MIMNAYDIWYKLAEIIMRISRKRFNYPICRYRIADTVSDRYRIAGYGAMVSTRALGARNLSSNLSTPISF